MGEDDLWVDDIFRNIFCEQHHAKCYATVFLCNTIYLKKIIS